MRRLTEAFAVVVVLSALALVMGCGSSGPGMSPGPSVGTAGKPQPPPAYTVTDLGSSVAWGRLMEPSAINDSGQVAGRGTGSDNASPAWIWDNGSVSVLPNLPGCSPWEGHVLGMNSGGDIVGRVRDPANPDGHVSMSPVVWVAPPSPGGSYTPLEPPMPDPMGDQDDSGLPSAINASHEAVGRNGLGAPTKWFLWTPTGSDPQTPTGFAYQELPGSITLFDINDNHQAVGRDAAGPARWEWSGTVWTNETRVPLPSGGTPPVGGFPWISAPGDVTGSCTRSDGKSGSYVWQSGATYSVDIGLLSGCVSSVITDINSSGVIVGYAQTTPDRKGLHSYKSFVGTPVRTGGVITSYNLQDLATVAGLQLVFHQLGEDEPVITDAGAIACRGTLIRGSVVSRPLLLTPTTPN